MNMVLCCPTCGQAIDLAQGLFDCPNRGDGREHILENRSAVTGEEAETLSRQVLSAWRKSPRDPLTAFLPLAAARTVAGEVLRTEASVRLQEALVRLEGKPLTVTPVVPAANLARAVDHGGSILVKDETGQVAGSHKARHLAGTALYLEALQARHPAQERPVLAISSCGNAALAAATVARAAGYRLRTFVPDDVDPTVTRLLAERDAQVEIVPRLDTGRGDPCYLAFRRAVTEQGCVPFSCSGRDNWSNIEGGQSLGYEMALAWRDLGIVVDHLVIQVGGGALARSTAQALDGLHRIGLLARLPRIHACQTEGAFPFVRAWHLLLRAVARDAGLDYSLEYDRAAPPAQGLAEILDFQASCPRQVQTAVAFAAASFDSPPVRRALASSLANPSAFMWAWDGQAPHSLAHGILDDETYDWFFLARALLRTGGTAIAVPEAVVAEAHGMALAHTAIPVSATGSAGLAGLLTLKGAGAIGPTDAVGLFFTGLNR
jgi:threonine synthase